MLLLLFLFSGAYKVSAVQVDDDVNMKHKFNSNIF